MNVVEPTCKMRNLGLCCFVIVIALHHINADTQDSACDDGCHHGTCQELDYRFHCQCNAGYSGTACTSYDYCYNFDCNNGTCEVRQHHSFPFRHYAHCECQPGYSGDHCEINELCQNFDCNSHGTCNVHVSQLHNNYAFCTCDAGYSGTHCATFDPCYGYNCSGRGNCYVNQTTPRCSCNASYYGVHCESYDACFYHICGEHGSCHEDPHHKTAVCTCDAGYSGSNCQNYDPCHDKKCGGHGSCIVISGHIPYCACAGGYSGSSCQNYDPCHDKNCGGHGSCFVISGHIPYCACSGGYSGSSCQTYDACFNHTCGEHGSCHEDSHHKTAFCTCDAGYSGSNCQNYDPCHNYVCLNGACMVRNYQPLCVCLAGYSGKHCESVATTTTTTTTITTPSTEASTTEALAAWSAWVYTPCSVTCGTGSKHGLRRCSSGHEEDCRGSSFTFEVCAETPCAVDGGWSDWQPWSACSHTCGNDGKRTRQRSCDNPTPGYGGTDCSGVALKTDVCNIIDCPHWSSWFFTPCSVTCGTGSKDGARLCSSGHMEDCPGSPVTTEVCHEGSCIVEVGWGNWLTWSVCSVTCGDGTRMRVRLCDNPEPYSCQGSFSQTATCKIVDCPQVVVVGK